MGTLLAAVAVRSFVRCFCELSPNEQGRLGLSQLIDSLLNIFRIFEITTS